MKDTKGKTMVGLVPMEAIKIIADVRQYGNEKYHDPENFRNVDNFDFYQGALRHLMEMQKGCSGVNVGATDLESGLPHIAHAMTGLALLWENYLNQGTVEAGDAG